jgi:hypothetical protein
MGFKTLGRMIVQQLVLLCFALAAHSADFSLKTADKPVPNAVGESIRGVLQTKGIQLTSGEKPTLQAWFRQEVPLKSKPSGDALLSIPETTVMGVFSIQDKGFQDYKGNDIPLGTYTARFGLQPQDGDHLGTADFNSFLILIPADSDKELNGIDKFKPMVKASGKATASGHPVVISLRPASGGADSPALTEPAPEHKAIRLKLPGKVSGGSDKADVSFDLVFQGKGHV